MNKIKFVAQLNVCCWQARCLPSKTRHHKILSIADTVWPSSHKPNLLGHPAISRELFYKTIRNKRQTLISSQPHCLNLSAFCECSTEMCVPKMLKQTINSMSHSITMIAFLWSRYKWSVKCLSEWWIWQSRDRVCPLLAIFCLLYNHSDTTSLLVRDYDCLLLFMARSIYTTKLLHQTLEYHFMRASHGSLILLALIKCPLFSSLWLTTSII